MATIDFVTGDDIHEKVREHYSEAAKQVTSGGCCGKPVDSQAVQFYTGQEAAEIPDEAVLASLGCGNPTALARLNPGEVVLDLGSGGGIDVLLSAKRVGPTGFAYGLDMTDEMLELAEQNRVKAGAENVKFLKGYIEDVPLPDNTVDVIISNCVINLAADKRAVLKEAFRVLKPGGRFAVSDVVVRGEIPGWLKRDMNAWAGCVSGALNENVYKSLLAEAGFTDIGIEVTHTYDNEDAAEAISSCCSGDASAQASGCGCSSGQIAEKASEVPAGLFVSAFIRATKPVK
jgi:arsenite methyltransferase